MTSNDAPIDLLLKAILQFGPLQSRMFNCAMASETSKSTTWSPRTSFNASWVWGPRIPSAGPGSPPANAINCCKATVSDCSETNARPQGSCVVISCTSVRRTDALCRSGSAAISLVAKGCPKAQLLRLFAMRFASSGGVPVSVILQSSVSAGHINEICHSSARWFDRMSPLPLAKSRYGHPEMRPSCQRPGNWDEGASTTRVTTFVASGKG